MTAGQVADMGAAALDTCFARQEARGFRVETRRTVQAVIGSEATVFVSRAH